MKRITRRSDIQRRKIFGGKTFTLENIYASRTPAETAKHRYGKNKLVRIIKFSMFRKNKRSIEYGLYTRSK